MAVTRDTPVGARRSGPAGQAVAPVKRWSPTVYDEVRRTLTRWGAALDDGMLYLDARLSANFPTLEVRVADVCTDLDDAVLVAALTRALVTTVAEGLADPGDGSLDHDGRWRSELLRAATWRASRYRLVESAGPSRHHAARAPAREVLARLIGILRPALENDGDLRLVQDLTERLHNRGGGATRQRRVFETDGRPRSRCRRSRPADRKPPPLDSATSIRSTNGTVYP